MNFYLWRDGAEEGPFTFESFQAMFAKGELHRETLFRRDADKTFEPLGDLVFDWSKKKESEPAPPRQLPPAWMVRCEDYTQRGDSLISGSRTIFWLAAIILAVAIMIGFAEDKWSGVTLAAATFIGAALFSALLLIAGLLYRILASLERK